MGFAVGNDAYVKRIITLGNLPNFLDTDQLRKAASLDPKYQQLMIVVNNGDSLPPPESGINQKIFAEVSTMVTKSYHLI